VASAYLHLKTYWCSEAVHVLGPVDPICLKLKTPTITVFRGS